MAPGEALAHDGADARRRIRAAGRTEASRPGEISFRRGGDREGPLLSRASR